MPNIVTNDAPTTNDSLGYCPYRDALVNIIQSAQTPLTIGIFGCWGSGKTSLMKMIKKRLDEGGKDRPCTIWFNAWKYDQEAVLWRALILHVTNEIRIFDEYFTEKTDEEKKKTRDALDVFEQSLYRTVEWEEYLRWNIDWAKALSDTVEGAAEIALDFAPGGKPLVELYKKIKKSVRNEEKSDIAEAFHREMIKHRREQVLSIEQFESQFAEIVKNYIPSDRRLVVFIDDLDRCAPDKILSVLEALKLFLDVKGCIFILGFDPEAVEEAIAQRFHWDADRGHLYLEKIIQLPFFLPPIEEKRMAGFIDSLEGDLPKGCQDVFCVGLSNNPREAKRMVNVFNLWLQLSQSKEGLSELISPVRLAKFVIIQHRFPKLYHLLVRNSPRLLRELEIFIKKDIEAKQKSLEPPQKEGSLHKDILAFAEDASLRDLLTCLPDEGFADLDLEKLNAYIYLSYSIQISAPEQNQQPFLFEPEMVRIEGAEFLLGLDIKEAIELEQQYQMNPGGLNLETPRHKKQVSSFLIGKYPVTNEEYYGYIRDTGHKPPDHWKGGQYPSHLSRHPVVCVSWDEATQYCLWLRQKTGKEYRLPTEAEWEYAARGNRNFAFPWGNEFDQEKCNTRESNKNGTTPINIYLPSGLSWAGCADMAGNVWEWTSDKFLPYPGNESNTVKYSDKDRILRGGSWKHTMSSARCTSRFYQSPLHSVDWIGFRCVCEI